MPSFTVVLSSEHFYLSLVPSSVAVAFYRAAHNLQFFICLSSCSSPLFAGLFMTPGMAPLKQKSHRCAGRPALPFFAPSLACHVRFMQSAVAAAAVVSGSEHCSLQFATHSNINTAFSSLFLSGRATISTE